jgi:hypothetical protein
MSRGKYSMLFFILVQSSSRVAEEKAASARELEYIPGLRSSCNSVMYKFPLGLTTIVLATEVAFVFSQTHSNVP